MLAYEIYLALFRAKVMRESGMDHAFYTAVATAVASAKIMGLTRDQIAEAVALAVTLESRARSHAARQVSMWKGCAAANGTRNGVFAALLAAEGMTGPDRVIEGGHGLRELVGKFDLPEFAGGDRPYAISKSNIKYSCPNTTRRRRSGSPCSCARS